MYCFVAGPFTGREFDYLEDSEWIKQNLEF
jgi:hypothetical protein